MEILSASAALRNGQIGKSGDPAQRHAEKVKKLGIDLARKLKNAKVREKKLQNASQKAVQHGPPGQISGHAPPLVL